MRKSHEDVDVSPRTARKPPILSRLWLSDGAATAFRGRCHIACTMTLLGNVAVGRTLRSTVR